VKASPVVQLVDAEQERAQRVTAARERRDAAHREYRRAQKALLRLEGREARHQGKFVSESQLQAARDELHRTRIDWQRAQRELLRSM